MSMKIQELFTKPVERAIEGVIKADDVRNLQMEVEEYVVTSEVAKGLAVTALETGKPVLFGVITTDTLEQAIERSGTKAGNKGFDAAMAAIEMANLYKAL